MSFLATQQQTCRAASQGAPDARTNPDRPDAVPLRGVMGRLADELHDLAGVAGSLEDLIGAGTPRDPNDLGFITCAQNFDLLIQRLEGVRRFLGDLGEALPADLLVDAAAAARAVTLKNLKDRLSFEAEVAESSTDFELF